VLGEQLNFKESEIEFKTALSENPRDITAIVQYGKILEKQNRYDDAVKQYKSALEINPDEKVAKQALDNLNKNRKASTK
jgi:tetratricopeptide (TPR) repeat protein